MAIINQIVDRVIEGNSAEVESLTKQALDQKEDPQKILSEGYIAGLDLVGEKFSAGEFFLPEMLMAGMAMKAGMEILKPLLTQSGAKPKGIIVVGTVLGDIHDIGKNLVCMMLEGAGFKVIDVGIDVPAEKFINAAKANRADIIALSALITATRANMAGITEDIRTSELGSKVKVMVGGASVTQEFADRIGADGYAPDANLATKKARGLLGVD